MAYDKEKILTQALEAIKEHKLTFFEEITMFIEPDRATLYNWEFDKLDTLKNALALNRIQKKQKMRNKWEESDNATLQLAAYKLIAEDEELAKLTMNKFEHTGDKGGAIQTENTHKVEFHDFT